MENNVKRFPDQAVRPPEDRAAKLAEAIETLLGTITATERAKVIKMVSDRVRPNPRAGEVLDAVVRLFKEKPEWAAEDLREQVPKDGVQATAKEIYNALSYLKRRDQIRKVGYGRYVLIETGAGIVLPDEDDGELPPSENYD